ncbi:MAG: preprotein translocase subunit YajC [Thermoanaerobaculales bacterium]|jgi:preprotein translocase subunit YajC|nr:preprotein translocase subunit YajC [Thermoanaerobaculales bacterium]
MEGAAGGNPLSMLLPFVLIFGVFYFIVIMPAKKQQKKKDAMIAALKKGDRIVTNGGIHGTVATVEDTSLLVKVSENTKIRISKSAIAGLVGSDGTPSEG